MTDLSQLSTRRTLDESRFQRNNPEEPEGKLIRLTADGSTPGDDPIGRLFLVPHSSQSLDGHSRLPGHPLIVRRVNTRNYAVHRCVVFDGLAKSGDCV